MNFCRPPLFVAGCFDGLTDADFVGADHGVHDAAFLVVDDDARDGGDVVFLREVAMFVDIDLLQGDAGIAFRGLFENRADAPAGAAPIGIEIDDRDLAAFRADGALGLRTRTRRCAGIVAGLSGGGGGASLLGGPLSLLLTVRSSTSTAAMR